jgi:hypothetical protein
VRSVVRQHVLGIMTLATLVTTRFAVAGDDSLGRAVYDGVFHAVSACWPAPSTGSERCARGLHSSRPISPESSGRRAEIASESVDRNL